MSNPATNPRLLSPNGFHVQKYTLDPSVRYIVLYGGSSSAKSFSVAQVLAMRSYYERSSTLVMRKVGASIERTIYSDFRAAIKGIKGFSDVSTFKQNSIVFKGGGKIDFSGLDDPEKIKGISQYKRVFLDELSEYTESDFKQIRLRLRGQEGQQILAAFNPISEEHWIKKKWFDKEKWHEVPMLVDGIKPELCKVKSVRMNETKYIPNPITGEYDEHAPDTVIIQSTYLNNFWVVGSPDGKYGYYDYQTIANFERDRINDPDYYQVYALGEWGHIRTGAEFFPSFNRGVVCGDFSYNPELPLHLCMDSNVLPYVTATFFQKEYKPDDYQQVTQVGELPIESPNNSARKAASVIAAKLREWKYDDKLYLHGDASGKAANTIDPNNRSFFDLVIDELEKEGYEVVDCISGKNPSVSTTGEFINAIWDGLILKVALCVDNNCKTSIDDYQAVQKDENGAILKTKVTDPVTKRKYEQHGHCFVGDTMVTTDHGDVPIMDIEIGDKVLTRFGYSNVYNSFCTSRNTRYFLVTLCTTTLRCTYDHRVYTSRGFVPAYQLKAGDEIITIKDGKQSKEKLQHTTVGSSIATLIQNLKAIGNTLRDGLKLTERCTKCTSIATFGLSSVAKFLKAIAFITLMGMSITIQSATLLLCWLTTMPLTIIRMLAKSLSNSVYKHCKTIERKQQYGTRHMKDTHGILKTLKCKWQNASIRHILAPAVAKVLKAVRYKVANSAGIIANQNGEDCKDLTMFSGFAQFAAMNLLSIATLSRSIVERHVQLSIGGRNDVYDISVDDSEFFADGVLVHNCTDCLRYVCYDLLRAQYTEFSMGRKRSYIAEGDIKFFNPSATYKYERTEFYFCPNVSGKFVAAHIGRVGGNWHLLDACYSPAIGNNEVKSIVTSHTADEYVAECQSAYFPLVRELRDLLSQVSVMKANGDPRVRISAMNDWVKSNIHINPEKMSGQYADFVNAVLDYSDATPPDSIGPSMALSGLARVIMRNML